jgi:diadenosine tetraphosphatase ApaH/serine/threonine PP2A family protein phosphatase
VIVAVLSDVHGNREALEAVLLEAERLGAGEMWFLGDMVGYNADPDFCAAELMRRASLLVRGNHDKACAGLLSTQWFNSVARSAVEWTRRTASPSTLESLARLPAGPLQISGNTPERAPGGPPAGFVLCHGTPFDEDVYMVEPGAVADSARWMRESVPWSSGAKGTRVCFHGHTHRPFACRLRGGNGRPQALPSGELIALEDGFVYLVNPGSVGQPRDGTPGASFGILDTTRLVYRTRRVPYRVEETQRKILSAGLPRELAWRLAEGM